ncbi:MAG TPA: hypothetical protein VGC55_01195, partial [Dokdonella sp.]
AGGNIRSSGVVVRCQVALEIAYRDWKRKTGGDMHELAVRRRLERSRSRRHRGLATDEAGDDGGSH